jgi:hypothetical protein
MELDIHVHLSNIGPERKTTSVRKGADGERRLSVIIETGLLILMIEPDGPHDISVAGAATRPAAAPRSPRAPVEDRRP